MRIESERQSLAAPLSHAALESFENGVLTVRLPKDYEAEILREHLALIMASVADVVGEGVRIDVLGERKGRAPRAAAQPPSAAAAEEPSDLLQYANERIR
jgi:hypothetical protein